MAVDHIADEFSIPLDRSKFHAVYGKGSIDGVTVILVKPQAYMNMSGNPIRKMIDYFRIAVDAVLVIHDDVDLEFGRIQIKEKGGDGGHKGIRSIMEFIGGGDFKRLRIGIGGGIGSDRDQKPVTAHVLEKFDSGELAGMAEIMTKARDAVVTMLCQGTTQAMNRFNIRHH